MRPGNETYNYHKHYITIVQKHNTVHFNREIMYFGECLSYSPKQPSLFAIGSAHSIVYLRMRLFQCFIVLSSAQNTHTNIVPSAMRIQYVIDRCQHHKCFEGEGAGFQAKIHFIRIDADFATFLKLSLSYEYHITNTVHNRAQNESK